MKHHTGPSVYDKLDAFWIYDHIQYSLDLRDYHSLTFEHGLGIICSPYQAPKYLRQIRRQAVGLQYSIESRLPIQGRNFRPADILVSP